MSDYTPPDFESFDLKKSKATFKPQPCHYETLNEVITCLGFDKSGDSLIDAAIKQFRTPDGVYFLDHIVKAFFQESERLGFEVIANDPVKSFGFQVATWYSAQIKFYRFLLLEKLKYTSKEQKN